MALTVTRQIILLVLQTDPTINETVRKSVMRALDDDALASGTGCTQPDKVLSRNEVARIMGVKPRTVTYYAKRGVIRPIRNGVKGSRASGYSAQSVQDAMSRQAPSVVSGKTAKKASSTKRAKR